MDLYKVAEEITDEVLKPVTLQIGHTYLHPEDGEIEITGGYYRDPIYNRISNFWYWKVLATGEIHSGYGTNWPERLPDV